VLADKTYTNEMWHFQSGITGDINEAANIWRYRIAATVTGLKVGVTSTIQVEVDSAAQIAAGHMRADCADVRIVRGPAGDSARFFVEPLGAPSGCGASKAIIWVEVRSETTGSVELSVLFGNNAAEAASTPAIFSFWEDFEDTPVPSGWGLDDPISQSCGVSNPDAATFETSTENVLHGKRSLKVSSATKAGGAFFKRVTDIGDSFILKGFLWDLNCTGSFWISPDFTSCKLQSSGGKPNLPSNANALGVHTSATPSAYAATYPWGASAVSRSQGWHSFSFSSDGSDDRMVLVVDDYYVARTTKATTIDKVLLWGSKVPEEMAGSDAYWDAIFAVPYSRSVVVAVNTHEAVAWSPNMSWIGVGASGAPTPRQGHSLVTAIEDSELLMFGGERAGHYYSDVWRYTISTDSWALIAARGISATLPRTEHSAIMHGNMMFVFGGRSTSGSHGDLWSFDRDALSWTRHAAPKDLKPRFGHAVAAHNGHMYVLGGHAFNEDGENRSSKGGKPTSDVWSLNLETFEWKFMGPNGNVAKGVESARTLENMLQFPALLPIPRLSAMASTASADVVYYLGGLGGIAADEDLMDVWKLHLSSMLWQRLESYEGAHAGVARSDSTLIILADGHTGFVFGGSIGGPSSSNIVDGSYMLYLA